MGVPARDLTAEDVVAVNVPVELEHLSREAFLLWTGLYHPVEAPDAEQPAAHAEAEPPAAGSEVVPAAEVAPQPEHKE